MSALLPKADIAELEEHVRFVPKADMRPIAIAAISGADSTGQPAAASFRSPIIRFLQCPIYPTNGSATARQGNRRPSLYSSTDQGGGKRRSVIGSCCYFRPTARRIIALLRSAAWPFFFSHCATSRQIDEFDRCSGGPAVSHSAITACLARSRSGCLRAANGVVAVLDIWRLSQARKSSSTIANPLIGSVWSSLMI